jgi:hypothetical protein
MSTMMRSLLHDRQAVASAQAYGFGVVELIIRRILADGSSMNPQEVISRAIDEGAKSEAVAQEALWSLIGDNVIQVTEDYLLRRVR